MPGRRSTTYWPGCASGNGSRFARCIVSDTTSAASRSIVVTFSDRKPGAAGCAADAGARPAERLDLQRAFHSVAWTLRRIEERVDLGDRDPLLTLIDLYDLVAAADLAFLEGAEIESRSSTRDQKSRHARLVHANADAIASYPGLGDFEQSAANPIAIAEIDAVVGQAFDRKIFAELSVSKVSSLKPLLPVAVGLDLMETARQCPAGSP
jgi:hypothetical protein